MDRILIVDDDPNILEILSAALQKAGYPVITAGNGNSAVKAAEEGCSLIIMDVMMPELNGILATMRIREKSNVPILMLSAKAEGSDRILGLEAGADDYLIKPFDQQELLARVKALLRRYQDLGSIRETRQNAKVIRVRDISLDTAGKQLSVRGSTVHLTATEYKILELLMSNPEQVFSAEEIYSKVWNCDAYAVENTVMVHISRIREKLELNPKKPEYIKVVWGIGYVFKAS